MTSLASKIFLFPYEFREKLCSRRRTPVKTVQIEDVFLGEKLLSHHGGPTDAELFPAHRFRTFSPGVTTTATQRAVLREVQSNVANHGSPASNSRRCLSYFPIGAMPPSMMGFALLLLAGGECNGCAEGYHGCKRRVEKRLFFCFRKDFHGDGEWNSCYRRGIATRPGSGFTTGAGILSGDAAGWEGTEGRLCLGTETTRGEGFTAWCPVTAGGGITGPGASTR